MQFFGGKGKVQQGRAGTGLGRAKWKVGNFWRKGKGRTGNRAGTGARHGYPVLEPTCGKQPQTASSSKDSS